MQHAACNFLKSADFPVLPGPPIKWSTCSVMSSWFTSLNLIMESIMLSKANCCSWLFGWVALRLSSSWPCHAITSGFIQRDIASSSSVGTPLGVGKPNFSKDERLLRKIRSRPCSIICSAASCVTPWYVM